MMAHMDDPSMGETQTGRWRIPDRPSETESSLSHIVKTLSKNKQKMS